MNVYCDGTFDRFHAGHLRQLEALAASAAEEEGGDGGGRLVVGVLPDEDAAWTLEQRAGLVRRLACVSAVVSPAPDAPGPEFLAGLRARGAPRRVTATSDAGGSSGGGGVLPAAPKAAAEAAVRGWSDVWERKGRTQDKTDVRLLTGYDGTDFDPAPFAARWRAAVRHVDGETVLDVGCGAGFLGDFLPARGYVGVEQSSSQAGLFAERSGRCVFAQDAQALPFQDGAFDHVISHSMLEYLPGKEAALRAIQEMKVSFLVGCVGSDNLLRGVPFI